MFECEVCGACVWGAVCTSYKVFKWRYLGAEVVVLEDLRPWVVPLGRKAEPWASLIR